MVEHSVFADAAYALSHATEATSDLCGPFVAAIGVSGAVVSTLGDPLGSQTICATNYEMARLDEIQMDLGEGPCWQALATRLPVLEPDVQGSAGTSWPLARQALKETGIAAVFAFPLVVAGIDIGAVDLYSTAAQVLSERQVTDASLLSVILARQVLRRALRAAGTDSEDVWGPESEYSRREVHQASGMIVAQLSVTPDDALLVLRGRAFAAGRRVLDVSREVISRTIDFTPND